MAEDTKNIKDPDHVKASSAKLNALRAAVLGANDGVVSVASIILGVAGATSSRNTILAAGIAGLVAGALSMAAGEYVSVSSHRDAEEAFIREEKLRLKNYPDEEFDDLTAVYQRKGLSRATARLVVKELTEHNAVKAHLDAEFNIDENDLIDPVAAAVASFVSFTLGGLIPLCAVLVVGARVRILGTVIAVLVTLAVTGYASAKVSRASRLPVILRVVIGGALAMLVTFGIGNLFGRIVG
jgi:VIT1/CCC1 family predicted Fe2+/Mn2+ transporter